MQSERTRFPIFLLSCSSSKGSRYKLSLGENSEAVAANDNLPRRSSYEMGVIYGIASLAKLVRMIIFISSGRTYAYKSEWCRCTDKYVGGWKGGLMDGRRGSWLRSWSSLDGETVYQIRISESHTRNRLRAGNRLALWRGSKKML